MAPITDKLLILICSLKQIEALKLNVVSILRIKKTWFSFYPIAVWNNRHFVLKNHAITEAIFKGFDLQPVHVTDIQ